MDSNALNARLDRAREALRALQARLAAQYGLCRIEVELREGDHEVRVEGQVLVDRLRAPVVAAVAEAVGGDWAVVDAMRVVQGGPWHAVDAPRTLFTAATGGAVVTVLHAEDGPVECLGEAHGSALVRDRCGTAAWTALPLGPAVDPPRLPRPKSRDPSQLVEAARRFLDVPYLLGGTDRDAIDCSGVVQRAAWWSLGVALPRNTGDLWGLGAQPGEPPPGLGHLVFVWTHGESLRHVGIAAGDAVVHASLSRQRVVSDPTARFYAEAARVDHLPFEALIAHGERCAGAPNILAAGVRLGTA